MRLASRVGVFVCALTVVCWNHPAFGVALDQNGEIKLGSRVYTAARLGTEHTDSPGTFPYSPAGHLRQHRTFIEAEFDHNLIGDGEDPFQMLLAAVWPDHDWSESALYARLTSCPHCGGGDVRCSECGNTGLSTAAREKLLAIENFAAAVFAETADATP